MTKPLLILDLDETLVYATERPLDRPCDFSAGPYSVYRRPYLELFLNQVAQWYELAVWTSSSAAYAACVVPALFPDPALLRFSWSRDRCTRRLDPEWREDIWAKDLRKVERRGYPLERIVIIDDSPEKLSRHYGNHLRLSPFTGDPADTELRDILPFLDWLRGQENFRRVEKRFWRRHSSSPSQLLPPPS